jgi:hypothetical protein
VPDSPTRARGVGPFAAAELWLVALILFGYGYFYNAHNWNHISRFDAIFAFVESDTPNQFSFRIDHFLVSPVMGRNTGDWARNESHAPHYYSNKAPGVMLVGVPVYALLYHTEALFGAVPESHAWTRINTYLLNLALSVVPAALAAVFFLRFARRRLGLADREAMLLTLLLFFATLIFPYATQLWGHTTAAAFLILALSKLLEEERSAAAFSGCFAGMAVLAEYSAVIPLFGMLILLALERERSRLFAFLLGGFPAFVVHFVYHRALFGSGFGAASLYNNPKFHEIEKLGGIFGGLEPAAFFGLSFSPHHGLFYFMPLLLLTIPALIVSFKRSGSAAPGAPSGALDRRLLLLSLWILAGFALMNLSFNGWHGGFCLGPRYLIPALPFAMVLLAPIVVGLRDQGRPARLVFALVAAISIANMSLLAMRAPSTTFIEEGQASPLPGYYADFSAGRLGDQRLSPLRLDGEWRVDARVVTQRNGVLALGDGSPGGGGPRAESFLHMSKPGRVRLVLGWQGDLALQVNGAAIETPHHVGQESLTIPVLLESGDNAISVSLRNSESPRISFFALASQGRPKLPRPSPEAPEPALSGSNLGRLLGLEGVMSVLPWMLGMAAIAWRLARALPQAADASD